MKCIHHNDHDGRLSGAIVAQYENNYNQDDFFEVDYIMDLKPLIDKIKNGEKVYIVDYSFKESTIWVLEELKNKNCDIIWCDHHTSSINLIKEYKELNDINGIRLDGISGAALIYMYLNENYDFYTIPKYIQLISDYDCWKFEFGDISNYFKIGIELMDYNALDNVWVELSKNNEELFNEILNSGKVVKRYIDSNNKFYCDTYSYESTICGHKALIVNKKSNSWIFGERIKDYDLVCVWVFNGEKYSYSIYTTNDDIDCSKIAESFGGGGHAGASGFSSDKLLFKALD